MKVLTVTDIHQSAAHYGSLREAVTQHRPEVVACVGDFLGLDRGLGSPLSPKECAAQLSALDVEHLVFVRGNHEAEDWQSFVYAWPFERRPLVALHGTTHVIGPLVIVGFPCELGWDGPWRETMPKTGNALTLVPGESGRKRLPKNPNRWLKPLLRAHDPTARTLWLLHEPPITYPLADPTSCNPKWAAAVERYQPLLTVSGHDHVAPLRNSAWHWQVGKSVCVNVGQSPMALRYCVLDFTFSGTSPSVPTKISVQAFPGARLLDIPGRC